MNTAPLATSSRILVVDDNPAIHKDFLKIFGRSREPATRSAAEVALFGESESAIKAPEFHMDSAYQGQEGLDRVVLAREEMNPYAMAFVDVRMPPGWDGIETTARIWERDPDIQIVVCTAYSDYSWVEMIEKLGRSDRLVILKKPFDTIEVVQLASALSEKWRLARQSRSIMLDLEDRVAERTSELARVGERLLASEAQYRLMFESNPHPMWVYDLETLRFVIVNRAAVAHYGYTEEEFLAMTIRDIRPEAEVTRLLDTFDPGMTPGTEFGVWHHLKKNGALVDVEISSDHIVFNGRPSRLVLAHDVTERNAADLKVKRLNRVYAVLSGINTLIVRVRGLDELFKEACGVAVEQGGFKTAWIGIVDRKTRRIVATASAGMSDDLWNAVGAQLTEGAAPLGTIMTTQAIVEKRPMISNDAQNDPRVEFGRKYTEFGVRSVAVLPLIVSGEGAGVLVLCAGESDFFHADERKLLTELANDIAFAMDHLEKQERLNYLAYYDALTGLANRGLFLERLAQQMRSAATAGHKLAVALIDLERFKNINDSLGRPEGDELLRQVAQWLIVTAGDASLVARVGADHFAFVFPRVRAESDAAGLLEKARQECVEHAFRLNETVFRIAFTAGAALFPEDGSQADTLFKHAEAALKKAKAGGERFLFYRSEMTQEAAGAMTLENHLRRAIENREFVLHYQPKVSLTSGKLTSAEALIRWNDPREGLVPPGRFIPILEQTGLIHDVGQWALRQAVNQYLLWRKDGPSAMRIAVNVSSRQLRSPGFVAEIAAVLAIDSYAPFGLELEITESLIMEDVKHSIETLKAVRDMGVTIAIDDFGTGFSSLSYLAKLPVDTLKIDRSFVIDMTSGPAGLALVSTIISLAHSLGLKVVAEGVETEEQKQLLRLLRCDEMQGFLFSKAVPVEAFQTSFLRKS